MIDKATSKRSLLDITLEEAIEVIKLGKGYVEGINYQLKIGKDFWNHDAAKLYYVEGKEEGLAVTFSDSKNAVRLYQGNTCYGTLHDIIKFLEERGFDLEAANAKD